MLWILLLCNFFQPEPLPEWYTPSSHEKMQPRILKNPVRKVKAVFEVNIECVFLQGCNRVVKADKHRLHTHIKVSIAYVWKFACPRLDRQLQHS